MKQFAVIGNPISHSKSPEIHTAFAAQLMIELNYIKLLADEGQFATTAQAFFEHGIGANVTVPFKEEAMQFADTLSEDARLAGAVNTLAKKNGQIIGDNTDGIGLVRDIRDNHGYSLSDKRILIIGAGGAARGVILPIARETPASITIANRTHEKATLLAKQFNALTNITARPLTELNQPFDIIINATSTSLSGETLNLNPAIFHSAGLAYDMMYGNHPTAFMQLAEKYGTNAVDGLGMLVEQAAQSFQIWHGTRPETTGVIKKIRAQLKEPSKN